MRAADAQPRRRRQPRRARAGDADVRRRPVRHAAPLRPDLRFLRAHAAEPAALSARRHAAGSHADRRRPGARDARRLRRRGQRLHRHLHRRQADRPARHPLCRPRQRVPRRPCRRHRATTAARSHIAGAVKREYFLMGTDSNGRDLFARTHDRRPHLADRRRAGDAGQPRSSASPTAPSPASPAAASTTS